VILRDMLLPKMTGPDVLKALKRDPETEGIAVVVFTGVSQKNPVGLQQDGACAFLEKSDLGLDPGCDSFLAAPAGIVKKLNLQVPGLAK
jgi:CheY-like chemotaxis protein